MLLLPPETSPKAAGHCKSSKSPHTDEIYHYKKPRFPSFIVTFAAMKHTLKFTQRRWFKNLKYVFLCAIMLSACLFMALTQHETRRLPLPVIHLIGWAGLAFFGCAFLSFAYINVKYLCQGRKLVEFTDEGLLTRSTLIPWGAITCIAGTKNFVVVDTDGSEEGLTHLSPLKRWVLRSNKRMCGGKYTISDFDYDGTQEEFCERLKEERERRTRK